MTRGVAVAHETAEAERAERIQENAKKTPIALARRIVDRHFAELRHRHLLEVPAHMPSLVLTREQLEHDIASAILDARKSTEHHPRK